MLKIQKLEWLMLLLQQYTLTIKCTRFLSRFSCMFCSFFYSHQCSKNNLSFIRSRKKKVQFRKIMDHLVLILFMYFLKIRVLKLSSACAWFLDLILKNKGNFLFGKQYVVGMDEFQVYNVFRIITKEISNSINNILVIHLYSAELNKHNDTYPTIALCVGENVLHPYGSYWVTMKITYQNVYFFVSQHNQTNTTQHLQNTRVTLTTMYCILRGLFDADSFRFP